MYLTVDEVAVIDEIQMIRDPSRGWAWTRALLGLLDMHILLYIFICNYHYVSHNYVLLYIRLSDFSFHGFCVF